MSVPVAPSPALLVIDDEPDILHAFHRFFHEPAVTLLTASSATEGIRLAELSHPDAVLLDLDLPDRPGMEVFRLLRQIDAHVPIIVFTGQPTMETAIEAMMGGAHEYLTKPLGLAQVRDVVAAAFRIGRRTRSEAAPKNEPPEGPADVIVGRCPAMQEVFKAIGRVAPQNINVLILGESGTGKELVARAIYQHSKRANGPFLAINCAAIPEALLESELFGHEKGAFTGAERRRIGKFEQCSGGTIFLDEIGDMPPALQAKLLRVLQEQAFERLGGNETVHTDVRLLAATNIDLDSSVIQGRFRRDLYYRLGGFGIALPPLRERGEDLPLLVEHLLRRFSREMGKEVQRASPEALEVLRRYAWPGNVRELQSVLRQALLRAHGPVLLPDFLPPLPVGETGQARQCRSSPGEMLVSREAPVAAADPGAGGLEEFIGERLRADTTELYAEVRDRVDRQVLARVLEHTGGNQVLAARHLGITRGKLRKRLRDLGISARQPRGPQAKPPCE